MRLCKLFSNTVIGEYLALEKLFELERGKVSF